MYQGHERARWQHTASLLCMSAEINRNVDKRSTPFHPSEFHPMEESRHRAGKQRVPLSALKDLFA